MWNVLLMPGVFNPLLQFLPRPALRPFWHSVRTWEQLRSGDAVLITAAVQQGAGQRDALCFWELRKGVTFPYHKCWKAAEKEKKLSHSTDALWFWCLPKKQNKKQTRYYKPGWKAISSDTLWFGCILFVKTARGQLTLVMMMWFWYLIQEK